MSSWISWVNSTNRDLRKDFWRSVTNNRTPDWVNDVTEWIYHDWTVHIWNAETWWTSWANRFQHNWIVSYIGNWTFQTQTINTNIPIDSIQMPLINIRGNWYWDSNTIDLDIIFYTYNVPSGSIIANCWTSKGTVKPVSIRAWFNAWLLVLELNWWVGKYFYRYWVSVYADWPNTVSDSVYENWTVVNWVLPWTTTNIVTIQYKWLNSIAADNDLWIWADWNLETWFSLHRDTTTTWWFYRHWNNNRTWVTTNSKWLIYGINNYWLWSWYWDATNIWQWATTLWYYNSVLWAYSLANWQQNTIWWYASRASWYNNNVAASYSDSTWYSNIIYSWWAYSRIWWYNNQINWWSYNYIDGSSNQILWWAYNSIHWYNSYVNWTYLHLMWVRIWTLASPITWNGFWSGNAHIWWWTYLWVFWWSNNVTGSYNVVWWLSHTTSNAYNWVFWYNSNVSWFGNLVWGYQNVVTWDRWMISGNANNYAASMSIMWGTWNRLASWWYGSIVVWDNNNVAWAYTKSVLWYYNVVAANTHVVAAIWQQNNISATAWLVNNGSIAIWANNILARWSCNVTIGHSNTTQGTNSQFIGTSINANVDNAVIIAWTSQLLWFYWDTTPVAKQTLAAAATNAATAITLANSIRTALINLWLVA